MLRKSKHTDRRGTHTVVLSQNAACVGWLSRRGGHILGGFAYFCYEYVFLIILSRYA
jgi:hypothetical protein